MTTRIGKVVDGYCKEVNVEKANIRFLFEGRRLGDQDTPQSVGLEDGDQIDCFYEATGGCS
jgi:small ubiquitin-related modifier